jgi:hypothetical protein
MSTGKGETRPARRAELRLMSSATNLYIAFRVPDSARTQTMPKDGGPSCWRPMQDLKPRRRLRIGSPGCSLILASPPARGALAALISEMPPALAVGSFTSIWIGAAYAAVFL